MPKIRKKKSNELEKVAPNVQLTILTVSDYKGYHYIIQEIGNLNEDKRLFQYIIFDKVENKFYQTYVTIKPDKDAIKMSDIVKTLMTVKQMTEATIETLLRKADPEYKGTEEEEKMIAEGEIILGALENASKQES